MSEDSPAPKPVCKKCRKVRPPYNFRGYCEQCEFRRKAWNKMVIQARRNWGFEV